MEKQRVLIKDFVIDIWDGGFTIESRDKSLFIDASILDSHWQIEISFAMGKRDFYIDYRTDRPMGHVGFSKRIDKE